MIKRNKDLFQKAIDILKIRWPEAVLVICLFAGWLILYGEVVTNAQVADQTETELPFLPNFILGLGVMMMFTICLMLWLGFLKTSAMNGPQPQQPNFLLRAGQPYFWKAFFFILVYELVCALVVSFAIAFIWLFWKADLSVPIETQIESMTKFVETSPRLIQILTLFVYLVLIKPLLFIPSRIIVFGNTVTQALVVMRRYRLGEIERVFIMAAVGFTAVIVLMLVSLLAPEKSVMYYVLSAVCHLLFCAVMLFLLLLAVLWMQGHRDAEQAPLPQESK